MKIPLQFNQHWYTIPAVISNNNGSNQPITAMVDTGLGGYDLVISDTLANQLNLQRLDATNSTALHIPMETAQVSILPNLEIAGHYFKNLLTLILPNFPHPGAPYNAILGAKFLKEHKAHINCGQNTLTLDTNA